MQLPRHMLILFVGIVFSVINPLVPVMTIVYFAVALLTERYNLLYIYTPIFESGGKVGAMLGAQPAICQQAADGESPVSNCLFSLMHANCRSVHGSQPPHKLNLASFWS